MDWFERLTGFREVDYEGTRQRLEVAGDELRSKVNGRTYGIGTLEIVSLSSLRERHIAGGGLPGRIRVGFLNGDVRKFHAEPGFSGALFQVASQFNLLEMTSPDVVPEDGVAGYRHDRTQGPACAIAAGAATIYRNYFVPVDGAVGQTRERQLDMLADLGEALALALDRSVRELWAMRNGYALCTPDGLRAISGYLQTMDPESLDALRGKLRIGWHRDVDVTDAGSSPRPVVSQAFCSALPVAYSRIAPEDWAPFASLILEAAYEATMLAAASTARRGGSGTVLLTRLGGGAFGNNDAWIDAAIARAIERMKSTDLDVRLVSYGNAIPSMAWLAERYS